MRPAAIARKNFYGSGVKWSGELMGRLMSLFQTLLIHREHFARRVCQEFGWINPAGKLKTMSCKVALLRMHRAEIIALPAAIRPAAQRCKKPDTEMLLPLPPSLIALSTEQLRGVRLDVVQTQADRALYHQLLQAHPYLTFPR